MKHYLYLAAIASLLAGCGGGGDGSGNDGNGEDPQATAASTFIAFVTDLVSNTADMTEPVAIDTVNAAPIDTTEPVPVM